MKITEKPLEMPGDKNPQNITYAPNSSIAIPSINAKCAKCFRAGDQMSTIILPTTDAMADPKNARKFGLRKPVAKFRDQFTNDQRNVQTSVSDGFDICQSAGNGVQERFCRNVQTILKELPNLKGQKRSKEGVKIAFSGAFQGSASFKTQPLNETVHQVP